MRIQMRYAVHGRDGWPIAMLGFSTAARKLVHRQLPQDWTGRYSTTPRTEGE